jgi:hypothetical protein
MAKAFLARSSRAVSSAIHNTLSAYGVSLFGKITDSFSVNAFIGKYNTLIL